MCCISHCKLKFLFLTSTIRRDTPETAQCNKTIQLKEEKKEGEKKGKKKFVTQLNHPFQFTWCYLYLHKTYAEYNQLIKLLTKDKHKLSKVCQFQSIVQLLKYNCDHENIHKLPANFEDALI